MNGWLETLRRFALSKGGVPLLIVLLIGGAFTTGYNWYAVKDAFGQVEKNEEKIAQVSEMVAENRADIRAQQRQIDDQNVRDEEMRRLLTIIGCEVVDEQTARDLMKCGSINRRENK